MFFFSNQKQRWNTNDCNYHNSRGFLTIFIDDLMKQVVNQKLLRLSIHLQQLLLLVFKIGIQLHLLDLLKHNWQVCATVLLLLKVLRLWKCCLHPIKQLVGFPHQLILAARDNDKMSANQINKSKPILSINMLLPSTNREKICLCQCILFLFFFYLLIKVFEKLFYKTESILLWGNLAFFLQGL